MANGGGNLPGPTPDDKRVLLAPVRTAWIPRVTDNAQFNTGAMTPVAPSCPASELASPSSRFWASLIDGLVLIIPLLLILVAEETSGVNAGGLPAQLPGIALEIAYGGVLVAMSGRTLGMRAMGIRVIALASGSRVTSGQAWLRATAFTLPGLIPTIGPVLNIVDCAWLLWDKPNRQTLHDKVARTIVVADSK